MPEDFVILPLPPTTVFFRGWLPGDAHRGGSVGNDFVRGYFRTALVETLDNMSAAFVAISCQSIPELHAVYNVTDDEKDLTAIVTDLKAAPYENHPKLWAVTVTYSSKPADHPDYQNPNPLLRRARWRTRFERFKEAVDSDYFGNARVNSAGDPYTPYDRDQLYEIIEIKKNVALASRDTQRLFIDAVNATEAFGREAYTLKVHNLEYDEEQWEGGVRFYPATLTMHWRPLGVFGDATTGRPWRERLLDSGWRYFDIAREVYVNFRDVDNQTSPRESLLDGNGEALAHGADPVFNEFVHNDEINFGALVALFS